jgi:hypothetical protein
MRSDPQIHRITSSITNTQYRGITHHHDEVSMEYSTPPTIFYILWRDRGVYRQSARSPGRMVGHRTGSGLSSSTNEGKAQCIAQHKSYKPSIQPEWPALWRTYGSVAL